jgi:hypothetical protein
LPTTGIVDATTQAMLANAAVVGANQSQVTGQLFVDYGLPANGVTLRLYRIGFGRTAAKLAETQPDANGVYSLAYAPPPAPSTPQAVYDSGWLNSADLVPEPQNILPQAYAILANRTSVTPPAVFSLKLPFDLWIETVRGFLNYFKISLLRLVDIFRPADRLELLTDANNYPYYRASIFAENLGGLSRRIRPLHTNGQPVQLVQPVWLRKPVRGSGRAGFRRDFGRQARY